ncbi:MAG: ABC transporter substrate-binding protein [Syntrophomonadaceae bacterium]|nr:ABC transporter substrate-binding protein [Syntrophomonadaceae bacterium]
MLNKKLLLSSLIIILLLGLVGCEKNDDLNNLDEVTLVLDWYPNTNHTGFYVAEERGYYAEEGLIINIIQPSDGGTAQLIAAEQGDFGISYQEEVTLARAKEIPVVAIATIIQHNTAGYASPLEKNITSPKDFINKTYGGAGTPSETALLKVVMDNHQQDSGSITQLNIGSADFFTSIKKDIDFSLIYYGWTGIEAEVRSIPINFIPLKDEDERLDFYTPLIIANENKIQNEAALIARFLRATSKGYEYAINNPKEAANILIKAVPELNPDLVIASQKYLANEYKSEAARWGEMEVNTWESFTNFMLEHKLINNRIDSMAAFTNEFLP